jgi:hypothetical protein
VERGQEFSKLRLDVDFSEDLLFLLCVVHALRAGEDWPTRREPKDELASGPPTLARQEASQSLKGNLVECGRAEGVRGAADATDGDRALIQCGADRVSVSRLLSVRPENWMC